MCKSTIVTLLCKNAGCIRIIVQYSNDRDWDIDLGLVEMCEQMLSNDVNNDHDHELECFDITGRADVKCQRCFEEDAGLALQ